MTPLANVASSGNERCAVPNMRAPSGTSTRAASARDAGRFLVERAERTSNGINDAALAFVHHLGGQIAIRQRAGVVDDAADACVHVAKSPPGGTPRPILLRLGSGELDHIDPLHGFLRDGGFRERCVHITRL